MIHDLKISRDIALDNLNGFSRVVFPYSQAAFYAYFKIKDISDSEKFCFDTLEKTGVGLAPGTSFGKGGNKWIRICYAKSPDLLNKAFEKLKPMLS